MINVPSIEVQKEMREKDWFDARNVTDRFKGMNEEVIRSILKSESSEMILCLSNLIRDINHGSAIRSANSFNINKVVMTGRRNYDRRGTTGTHKYMEIEYIEDTLEAFSKYRSLGYTIVAAEYDETRMQYNLRDFDWPEKSLLIVGEEGRGLESEILDAVDYIVYAPMYGSVRSLNLASAATIFLYDYDCKMKRK